jgi:hypothetical protein
LAELKAAVPDNEFGVNQSLIQAADKIKNCMISNVDGSDANDRKFRVEIRNTAGQVNYIVVPHLNKEGNAVNILIAGPAPSLPFSGMTVTMGIGRSAQISRYGELPSLENAVGGLTAVALATRDWWEATQPTPRSTPSSNPIKCAAVSF